LCKQAQDQLGAPPTLKISAFSDKYDSSKSYAGIIIYAVDGKFSWINDKGVAIGYKGRSFYCGILDTSKYPTDELKRDVGTGRVHHYLILTLTGREFTQDTVCCGGFAIHESKLKFSSVWLNARHQYPKESFGKSDQDKYLSSLEKELCNFAVDKWKTSGVNTAHELSDTLKSSLGIVSVKPVTPTPTPRFIHFSPPRVTLTRRWEWQSSDGSWHPYDATSTATLETKFLLNSGPFVLTVAKSSDSTADYFIDFSAMTQTYGTTDRYKRGIRRV